MKRERRAVLSGDLGPLKLFNEDKYNPTKVKNDDQKYLIYHNLHYHYLWEQREEEQCTPPPPTQLVKIEGLPGVGKSFIILCLRNIARRIKKSNGAELTSAPTGAASFLISAPTHFRLYGIPTAKVDFKAAPKYLSAKDASRVLEMHMRAAEADVVLMDEDSMTQDRTKSLIAALTEEGTYDSGCVFLLRWYVLEVLPAPSACDWWEQLVQEMTP